MEQQKENSVVDVSMANEVKTFTKTSVRTVVDKLHALGFWAILLLGAGAGLGLMYSNYASHKNMTIIIKVGRFYHDGAVYDITKRDLPPSIHTEGASTAPTSTK
jgi:hypothetical protein